MRRSVAILALLIASCSSKGDALVRQYKMLEANGATSDEKCAKARETADAFLTEENQQQYQWWHLQAGLDCNQARLDRLN